MRLRRAFWLWSVLVPAVAMIPAASSAHDMFLVVPDHDVPADADVAVSLYNGTFDKSENTIDRDRMIDVSVVDGEGEVTHPGEDQWSEDGNSTVLNLRTGRAGTYVVGLSTKSKVIELSAEDFNEYLEHDGVLDVLDARKRDGNLDQPAAELYSKHVKTLLQVGGVASDSYSRRLGYPIEIVPLANPADLSAGDGLDVLVLHGGEPVGGQLVYASYAGYHGHGDDGAHREAVTVRTDDEGKATIGLTRAGRWYVRLIRMLPSSEEGMDYESNWATLTFEIGD
jgi:uncharacterized GH25 family protein